MFAAARRNIDATKTREAGMADELRDRAEFISTPVTNPASA
jgi:hypothetical protein